MLAQSLIQTEETPSPKSVCEDRQCSVGVGRFTGPGIDQGAPSAVYKDDRLGK